MKTNRILAAILTVIMVLAALFLGLQSKPVSRDGSLYITDKAGVISAAGEREFAILQQESRPRLSVAVVNSTGKLSTAKYCEALWNNWALGTSDMLLLMVTGKQDYYFGYDTASSFAYLLDSNFDELMENWLEPWFAAGDYEGAIFALSEGVQVVLSGTSMPGYEEYFPGVGSSSGMSMIGLILVIAIIIIFVAVVAAGSVGKTSTRRTRTVYRTPTPPRSTTRTTISRPVTPSRTTSRPVTPPVSRPRTTIRTSATSRPRSSGGFSGGSRPRSGGFSGGGRSGGFGGGGRSGGMGGRGRR